MLDVSTYARILANTKNKIESDLNRRLTREEEIIMSKSVRYGMNERTMLTRSHSGRR